MTSLAMNADDVPAGGVKERAARGKAARQFAPLDDHARFERSPTVDPMGILATQALTRVPELLPIRHGRMAASPFAFYRGAAGIMAADLSSTPSSGLRAQVCGDAHLSNFGLYLAPDRRMVFDVNDFDETLPGPWEWDVKRLVASVEIAGRERGFTDPERRKIALAAGSGYREAMRDFAGRPNASVWYARVDVQDLLRRRKSELTARQRSRTAAAVTKAGRRDSLQAARKITRLVDGERRLISDPPLLVPLEDLLPAAVADETLAGLTAMLSGYRRSLQHDRRALLDQFRLAHVAHKVVGVGSVGTRAWVILLVGRDDDDVLLLQAKEAQPSVLAPYVRPGRITHQGERVVRGQHLMQAATDIFLGTQRLTGPQGVRRDFYIRQLRDGKGSAAVAEMIPSGMAAYARLCAWTLARAHARSGDRVAIAGYLGSSGRFERAVADFAVGYADQNAADHAALVRAVAAGQIVASSGI
ncbi:DUF2252 domain-containing protein [Pengzhenrongella frigida]|uniref:DUF2252 domain-containing protein n=1 Tax=Pengzhenrongella frigida TaxID=1259133 RepID=A0A4Q5N234_9MICO|nr:DUF2252 domain-containing protein [Cellulomonas sp. HLT2-17]RYV50101.1 DUF2252 domain-containing protein [Cellulomonas sp. HLT2-17]